MLRAVLIGMAIAVPGFLLAMYNLGPSIGAGRYPLGASVMPIGIHTLFAGFVFAIGMIVAGGCFSGTLYRMGEGYVASWVTMGGILIGFLALGYTWSFWWDFSYTRSISVWFPHGLGWSGAGVLTLALIALTYVAVLWWESRAGQTFEWEEPKEEDAPGLRSRLEGLARRAFFKPWPIVGAAIALGGLNALFYLFDHPWGVTVAGYQWMESLSGLFGISPEELKGLADLGTACNPTAPGTDRILGLSDHTMINAGLIVGAFAASSIAGDFKVRLPQLKRRYVQSLGGGILMGYGSGLALGCTLGAFFSAIPSLALNGWGFGLGLLVGAYVGVKLIRRLG